MKSPGKDGFDQIIDLISEIKNLDGRKIQDVTFSSKIVISKTPDEAKKRSDYQQFLRDNLAEEEELGSHAKNFVEDIVRKHLD